MEERPNNVAVELESEICGSGDDLAWYRYGVGEDPVNVNSRLRECKGHRARRSAGSCVMICTVEGLRGVQVYAAARALRTKIPAA